MCDLGLCFRTNSACFMPPQLKLPCVGISLDASTFYTGLETFVAHYHIVCDLEISQYLQYWQWIHFVYI